MKHFTFKPLRAAMWNETNDRWDMKDPGDSDIYGNCYGPLNMRFNNVPLALLNQDDSGTTQTTYTSASERRLYGMKLTVPADCHLMVTDLGRYAYTESEGIHEIRLMQDDTLTSSATSCGYLTLASAVLNASEATSAGFQYESLTEPLLIGSPDEATVYYLVGREFSNGDDFATYNGSVEYFLGLEYTITMDNGYIAIDSSGNYSSWQSLGGDVKMSVNMKFY